MGSVKQLKGKESQRGSARFVVGAILDFSCDSFGRWWVEDGGRSHHHQLDCLAAAGSSWVSTTHPFRRLLDRVGDEDLQCSTSASADAS